MDSTKDWNEEECEKEFIRQCNLSCNHLLYQERERREIGQKDLSCGILSRTSLELIETGEMGWTKLTGDILMYRMGIAADYFEVVSSAEELDRWRLREEICLLIPSNPLKADEKLQKYRMKYTNRENVEEQFLKKAELLLRLLSWKKEAGGNLSTGEQSGHPGKRCEEAEEQGSIRKGREEAEEQGSIRKGHEEAEEQGSIRKRREEAEEQGRFKKTGRESELLQLSHEAVECTIPGGMERGIGKLWLSPAELEAVLLEGAACMVCGRMEEAHRLQKAVWEYPVIHRWEERMSVLILPQAALLGMALAMKENDGRLAFEMGKTALELLRRNCSQRYILPLLDSLGRLAGRNQEEKEYLAKAEKFAGCFRTIYQEQNWPEYRLWQNVSVENTRDVGTVLRMLRQFEGISHVKAVYDGEEQVVTPRQLMRIEKGQSKPSYRNYERLLKQYGKYCGWKAALLETDSREVLEARQNIATLIGFGQLEDAEREIVRLRRRLDDRYPRIRQELLLWDALYKWKRDNALEESVKMLKKALRCTVPDMEGKHRKWWVFQREETMIVNNIVGIYRKQGRLEEALTWAEDVLHSMDQQSARTGIALTGYDILLNTYDNLLADSGYIQKALEVDKEAAQIYLKRHRIRCLPDMYYQIAWNSYEIASKDVGIRETYRPIWEEAYRNSEILADFIYDSQLQEFLKEESRREKFLINGYGIFV